MSVQSVLFVHRPSNCYPLIGNCCHVRPVLPTGHPAVFFLNKGKGIGSPRPLSGAEGSTSPHLPRRPMGESFWGERQRRWGDDNAPQGGSGGHPLTRLW